MKKIILTILIIILIIFGILILDIGRREDTEPTNFKECVLKGYPILETFPAQCRTPDGKFFIEDVDDKDNVAPDKSDLIKVETPLPNNAVESPLVVSGLARGNWFFEASFPVILLDDNGNQIASGIAQAEGEWMTTEFVPFKAELNFNKPLTDGGKLILKKDNPSGLPEHDDELIIPVKFN